MMLSAAVAYQQPASEQVRAHLMVWPAVFMMLAATPVFGSDDSAYFYAPNDGMAPTWESREQGYYTDGWSGRSEGSQPRLRNAEPVRRGAEPWTSYDERPYTRQGGSDGTGYGNPRDGWSPSSEMPRSSADSQRPQYYDSYPDRLQQNMPSGPPRFQGQGGDYGYERSQASPDTWAGSWRGDDGGPARPQWHGAEDWQQNRYREPPMRRGERDIREEGGSRGRYQEWSRDPWEASYTPEWRTDAPSSYYEQELSDPWAAPELERNGWGGEQEDRPWARRRPSPPAESSRRSRSETRYWGESVPPEGAYRSGAGAGPYWGSGHYPGLYGVYPPPFGMSPTGALSGLAAWERLLWAAGWPQMIW